MSEEDSKKQNKRREKKIKSFSKTNNISDQEQNPNKS